MKYNGAIFKSELEELLYKDMYSPIDILPLVQKYTEDVDVNEANSIRSGMNTILVNFQNAGMIVGDFHAQMMWQRPLMREVIEDPIIITSTFEFEQYYSKKNTPPAQPSTIINQLGTHNYAAGRDLNTRDIKTNEEGGETKQIHKEALKVHKDTRLWTIVGVVIALLLVLLALHEAKLI
jgi:hypothetical protein